MKFVRAYIPRYAIPFCVSLMLLSVEAACDLLQPTIMARIVDVGVAQRDLSYVLSKVGLMLIVTLIGAAGAVGRNIVSSVVSMSFGADIRSDLFKKITSFSFKNIDRFETASLVTRMTNDVTQVQHFFHGLMRIFVKAPIMAAGSIVMAVMLNPRMSLILAAAVPLIAVIITVNLKVGYPFFMKVQQALDRVNSVMREYLAGVRVVKAFNRFDFEQSRFGTANEDLSSVSMRAMRTMALFGPVIGFTLNVGIIAVLWFGGVSVNAGGMHVGEIIALTNYMTHILFSLMMVSFVFVTFARARASAERIDEVFDEKNDMPQAVSPAPVSAAQSVVFDKVSFSYGSSGTPVLRDISIAASPGDTFGIVGSTGAGKSTLVNLLARFYDVSSGRISIGGLDIREADTRTLRERIAIVPQKTTLFTGTIGENIRWGNENASRGDIEHAAKSAAAHEFIMSFPEGYDTLLGQGGVNLSGGQKQRISIARALVRNPSILILDDCVSAVDVTTEAKIRSSLREFSKGLTVFVIAQRITSVMRADRILVLDDGAAAGIGTHGELMRTCAVYRDIFKSQIGEEEL
ncbi:MAG: ABC transporter ATP-binding protein [Spirochaetes bacterium]|nr:ABC transporter ATP-binding protein [Spirochaetota bacterium]